MMKKIILLFFLFLSCSEEVRKVNYGDAILGIESRTGELVTPGTLFNDSIFLNIFKHPDMYIEDAIAFLADSTHTEQQKMIGVFSMQNLTPNNYIDYADKSFTFYKQNKMTANTLRIVISSHIKSDNLKRTHRDRRFYSIVKDIHNAPESTEGLKGIAQVILENRWKIEF